MPWQTRVVLTKEVLVLRTKENARGIDPFLLLALFSLRVVQEQYRNLALMQTNREHLGDHWREVVIPMPVDSKGKAALSEPVKSYFDRLLEARSSYDELLRVLPAEVFGTRP